MHSLSNVQRNIWLLAAIPTSMAMITASPLWALPALCLAVILYNIVYKAIPDGGNLAQLLPRWLLVLEWCFLLVTVGKTAGLVADCWPKGNGLLFSLVLMTLAGAASVRGTASAGSVASVLGWITAGIIAVILIPLTLETSGNQESGSWMEGFPVLSSAMLPLCALFLPAEKNKKEIWLWIGIFITTILVLYSSASGQGEVPLLHAVKGLELFGIFRRFEAIAACILTIGLFLILSLFFCSAHEIAGEVEKTGSLRKGFYPAGVVMIFLARYIPDVLIQYGAPLFWGILPVLTLLVVPPETREKSLRKSEKRC